MKKIYKIGLVWLSLLVMGCSDFLAESSLDEVRPASVDDLEQLMLGEGYPMRNNFLKYLDLMTDEMVSSYSSDSKQITCLKSGASAFSWSADMYEEMVEQNVYNTDTWQHYYRRIKGCNVVLDNLDDMQGKTENRENLRGQALAMRAYYYFMLVNLYAQPYHAEGVDIQTAPGVPLILESAVKDEFPPRASIAQIYAQVGKDLLAAAVLLDKYGRNNIKYKVTDLFPYAVLARMYLYMENWEKAEEYASLAIGRSAGLRNLASVYTGNLATDGKNNVFSINSPELIWGYSNPDEISNFSINPPFVENAAPPVYRLSPVLEGLYEAENGSTDMKDLRLKFYFKTYLAYPFVALRLHGNKSNTDGYSVTKGIRLAEMYLNRAESYIRRYLKDGSEEMRQVALDDLNHLRENRYDTRNVEYVPVDYSGTALLDFYKEERQRELCFEEHRWFDLRRYGMPELEHELEMEQGQKRVIVLPARSPRYTLPIPKIVLGRNPALVPNP